jgi:hypothetical protein
LGPSELLEDKVGNDDFCLLNVFVTFCTKFLHKIKPTRNMHDFVRFNVLCVLILLPFVRKCAKNRAYFA